MKVFKILKDQFYESFFSRCSIRFRHQHVLRSKSPIKQIQVNEGGDLDDVWEAYFATNNKAYMQQILMILNQDQRVLYYANEYLKRQYIADYSSQNGKVAEAQFDDLKKNLARIDKTEQGFANRVLIAITALWSMESYSNDNPQVKSEIAEIIRQNPNLNYWKKIKSENTY